MATHIRPAHTHTAAAWTARSRTLLVVLAGAVPVLLVAQVYLAGLFLMGGEDSRDAHIGLGYALTAFPLLLGLIAVAARAPRRYWLALAGLFAAMLVQSALPGLPADGGAGLARALHPLNAFLVIGLAVGQLRVALHLER